MNLQKWKASLASLVLKGMCCASVPCVLFMAKKDGNIPDAAWYIWWHCNIIGDSSQEWSILQLAMDPHGVLVKYQDSMWTSQGLGKDCRWTQWGATSQMANFQSTSHPLPVQSTWSSPCGLHEDSMRMQLIIAHSRVWTPTLMCCGKNACAVNH